MYLCDGGSGAKAAADLCRWLVAARRALGGLWGRPAPGEPAGAGWFTVRDPHHFDRFEPGDVVRLVRLPIPGTLTGRYQRFPDGLIDDVMPHSLDPAPEPAGYVAGEWPPAGLIHRWPPDLADLSISARPGNSGDRA